MRWFKKKPERKLQILSFHHGKPKGEIGETPYSVNGIDSEGDEFVIQMTYEKAREWMLSLEKQAWEIHDGKRFWFVEMCDNYKPGFLLGKDNLGRWWSVRKETGKVKELKDRK